MGLHASADLIWGIPISAYDDEGEPTEFWNEDDDDWREFEGLDIVQFGSYEGDEPRAILTTKSIERFSADAFSPTRIPLRYLDDNFIVESIEGFWTAMEKHCLPQNQAPGWCLVASYG